MGSANGVLINDIAIILRASFLSIQGISQGASNWGGSHTIIQDAFKLIHHIKSLTIIKYVRARPWFSCDITASTVGNAINAAVGARLAAGTHAEYYRAINNGTFFSQLSHFFHFTGLNQSSRRPREYPVKRYKNPHTGDVIETRGGNHTVLKKWKSTYGGAVVEGWRFD
jgi:hypothetical protein